MIVYILHQILVNSVTACRISITALHLVTSASWLKKTDPKNRHVPQLNTLASSQVLYPTLVLSDSNKTVTPTSWPEVQFSSLVFAMFSQTSKISRLIQTEQRAAAEADKRISCFCTEK